MNWTERRVGVRRAGWLLVACGAAGCSGPRNTPAAAPPAMPHASGESAATRAERTRALDDQWASLAAVLPDEAAAVQDRLEAPRGAAGAGAGGVDLDAARIGLRRCESLWSKAQAAFAAGNMSEAVGTAITVKTQLDGLAAGLGVGAARGE